ncbi:MAG TPA: SRPBCC family protein [Terriglobales bacterium]|nr:SRPBCC family protein [Terriglobales bacterium]
MAKHFEYAIELSASPETVYRVFTDTARWRGSRVYRDIRWLQGEPWQKDSVREVDTEVPFRSKHKQRVLAVIPGQRISLLSHGLGYTMQLQIGLVLTPHGGTSVHYSIDVLGALPLLFGFLIDDFVVKFMNVYIAELERLLKEDARPASGAPARS